VTVAAGRRETTAVAQLMSPVVEVPESLALDDVLRVLQLNRAQLAVVVDEYGGTAGLLTGEDLLEELVRDVRDKYDPTVPAHRRVAGGWAVSGLLGPDEVVAVTGRQLPRDGAYATVGGLIMQSLARVPVRAMK
jgi:CBS domain containing-hemolysin-like protein